MDRKDVLLRAAYDLLMRADERSIALPATSIETRYDDANCDGACLREDIALALGIDDDTAPIPLGPEY